MIADRTTGRTVESTLDGKTIQMGVKIENMPHIMAMLIDQYADQELASLREYVTNAWDEHAKLGLNRPIEVSLPTRLSPFLRVKDYGVGMDEDTIEQVYSQYGASTKRDSNDFNGMLGIGSKAALSYTDQFTVISTKNGRTIQVSVHRPSSGGGAMQIVTDKHTGKPSGTEIIIPAKVPNNFTEKAEFLFGTAWKPGTVLVDGKQPPLREHLALIGRPGEMKDDDIWIIDGAQSYIVMGNVPYRANIRHNLPTGYDPVNRQYHEERAVVAFVPIGAVNFAPSREEVVSTDRKTIETIRDIEEQIESAKPGAVQRQIDRAATPAEAIQQLLAWSKTLGLPTHRDYTWRGTDLPRKFEPQTTFVTTGSNGSQRDTKMLVSDNSTKKLGRAERKDSLPVGQWPDTLIAYGYDRKGMTVTQKKKLQQYLTDKSIQGVKRFALTAEKPAADLAKFIGTERVVPWADVHAIKLPSAAATNGWTGRLPGSYDFFKAGVWEDGVAGDNIDRTYDIFYVHGGYSDGVKLAALLTKSYPNNYVVCLSANRIAKFCRIIPAAQEAHDAVAAVWKRKAASYSAAERLSMHIEDQNASDRLKLLDPSRLADPALRDAIRDAKVDHSAIERERAEFTRVLRHVSTDAVEWVNPLASYPLFNVFFDGHVGYGARRHRDSDDMYIYLNAKYEADQSATTTTKGA